MGIAVQKGQKDMNEKNENNNIQEKKPFTIAVPLRLLPDADQYKRVLSERSIDCLNPEIQMGLIPTPNFTDRIALEAALKIKHNAPPDSVKIVGIMCGFNDEPLLFARQILFEGVDQFIQIQCKNPNPTDSKKVDQQIEDYFKNLYQPGNFLKNHFLYGMQNFSGDEKTQTLSRDQPKNLLEQSPFFLQGRLIWNALKEVAPDTLFVGAYDHEGFSGFGSALAALSGFREVSNLSAFEMKPDFSELIFLKDSPLGLGKFKVSPKNTLFSFAPGQVLIPRELTRESAQTEGKITRVSPNLKKTPTHLGRFGASNSGGILSFKSRPRVRKEVKKIPFQSEKDIDLAVQIFVERLKKIGIPFGGTEKGDSNDLPPFKTEEINHFPEKPFRFFGFHCNYQSQADDSLALLTSTLNLHLEKGERGQFLIFGEGENLSNFRISLEGAIDFLLIPLSLEEEIKFFLEGAMEKSLNKGSFTSLFLDNPLNREVAEWLGARWEAMVLGQIAGLTYSKNKVVMVRNLFNKLVQENSEKTLFEPERSEFWGFSTTVQIKNSLGENPSEPSPEIQEGSSGSKVYLLTNELDFPVGHGLPNPEVLNIRGAEMEDASLKDSPLVIAAGYGVGKGDMTSFASSVRDFRTQTGVNAALGASKIVTDNGWLAKSRLIGQTGVVINAEIYIAVAISGAMQHLIGVNSEFTITFNKSEAAFSGLADLAIIGDWRETWPLFYEKLVKQASGKELTYRNTFQSGVEAGSKKDHNLPMSAYLSKQIEKADFHPDMMRSHIIIENPRKCATDCIPEKVGIYAKACSVICRAQNFILSDEGAMLTFNQEGENATIYEGCYQCGACVQVCPVVLNKETGAKNLDWRKPEPGHQLILHAT